MRDLKKVDFVSYETRYIEGRPHFFLKTEVTKPDGTVEDFFMQMPADTLEWRAAEYGLDPDDLNQLWDIALSEMFMGPEDYGEDPQLYTHMDMDAVRRAHLARVANVKWKLRLATRTTHPVHTAVKAAALMHPEAVELKQKHVHRTRMDHAPRATAARSAETRQTQSHENRMQHLRMLTSGADPQWPTEEDVRG